MRKTRPKEIWIPFSDQDQKTKEAEMNALLDSGKFIYKDAKMFRDEQTGERKKFWVLWRKGPGSAANAKIACRRFKGYKRDVEDGVDIDVTGPRIGCDSMMDVLGQVEDTFSLPSLHQPKKRV